MINKEFNEKDQETIDSIKREIISSRSPFKELMLQAINNSIIYARKEEYNLAANEINLIHNLPVSKDECKSWNEWSFYCVELPNYLEHIEDEKKVQQLIRLLAASQNLSNEGER
ncbi:MAG: hypothetical protein HC921_21720 [Synechococcaceae cyanobacterium SM2_3_1]|nr:hypothetical protein [Synechococcaceae cyanobacterium SM2_3_1]